MKKAAWLLAGILILSLACKKKTEEAIDCVIELAFVTFTYEPDQQNPKLITFTLEYAGAYSTSVEWIFDDGSTQTVTGTTVTHTYSEAGSYHVEANITLLAEDKLSCSVSKSRTVDVY